jgi:RNA polymerase sigma-70 factor (ECF subfamily)
VIILHDIEGYKHNEIAHLLDINEGTSKSQLYQARKAMRNNLKEYTINEEKL